MGRYWTLFRFNAIVKKILQGHTQPGRLKSSISMLTVCSPPKVTVMTSWWILTTRAAESSIPKVWLLTRLSVWFNNPCSVFSSCTLPCPVIERVSIAFHHLPTRRSGNSLEKRKWRPLQCSRSKPSDHKLMHKHLFVYMYKHTHICIYVYVYTVRSISVWFSKSSHLEIREGSKIFITGAFPLWVRIYKKSRNLIVWLFI